MVPKKNVDKVKPTENSAKNKNISGKYQIDRKTSSLRQFAKDSTTSANSSRRTSKNSKQDIFNPSVSGTIANDISGHRCETETNSSSLYSSYTASIPSLPNIASGARLAYKNRVYEHVTEFCSTTYRRDNYVYHEAIFSDRASGYAFQKFLERQGILEEANLMRYFHEADDYMCMSPTTVNNVGETYKMMKAMHLIDTYLTFSSVDYIWVFEAFTILLTYLLQEGQGDVLVKYSQDKITEMLKGRWHAFRDYDLKQFTKAVLSRKTRRNKEEQARMPYEHVAVQIDEPLQLFAEKRVRRSFELIKDLYHEGADHHLTDYKTPTAFNTSNDEGSLYVPKIVHYRRKFKQRGGYRSRLHYVLEDEEPEEHDSGVVHRVSIVVPEQEMKPFYMRPIRRNGQLIARPNRPRSFIEMMRDHIHLEFFKRYLSRHDAALPLQFWISVEDMKTKLKDLKGKNIKINLLVKKYFGEATNFGEDLKCNADVIKEIPKLEKVTPSMLISAQTCVAHDLEERWFKSYVNTFADGDVNNRQSRLRDGRRTRCQTRTQQIVVMFVRSVMCFRAGIMNQKTNRLFHEYLKLTVQKETITTTPKSRNAPAASPHISMKKINNKLIQQDKLVNDLAFLVEAERYRQMVDNATSAAQAGTYRKEDEEMVEQKAFTIICCFIESEIPPKIQINISADTAEEILETFQSGILDRGLFHNAMMSIFTVLVHFWKKFSKWRFSANPGGEPVIQPASFESEKPHRCIDTPIYKDFNLKTLPTLQPHGINYDDDHNGHFRIHFTLFDGLRYIAAHSERRKYNFGSQLSLAESRSNINRSRSSKNRINRSSNLFSVKTRESLGLDMFPAPPPPRARRVSMVSAGMLESAAGPGVETIEYSDLIKLQSLLGANAD
ncbi:unnamed protein product [Owenia fusiformis]|uniref:Uncharacterized protein n=1 Tax=Owenia fusiformis TaxID=6347 RepID=A0A8J1XTF0_OWEFU|nr:unnamed protein product [Owenia fusiformis]